MIISETPVPGAVTFTDSALVCGFAMLFSRSFHRGFCPAPFDPTVELCDEELGKRLIRSTEGDSITFEFARPPEFIGHIAREVIPLNLLHPHNYFHFLLEWLPSLIMHITERGGLNSQTVIATGILHPNMWQVLETLVAKREVPVIQFGLMQGLTADRIVQLRPAYQARELIQGRFRPPLYDREKLILTRNAFKRFRAPAGEARKIYIRRQSGARNIINWAEIDALALGAGYEIVDPGELNFFEQAKLFSQAARIVGPSGAWMANTLFAPQGTKIDIFLPTSARIETPFWGQVGEIFDLQLSECYCPVPSILEEHPIHSDFLVPPELAREILNH